MSIISQEIKKESSRELLAKVKFLKVKIDDGKKATLYLCVEETFPEMEKKAKVALQKGATVTWPDGQEQWIEDAPIMGGSTEGEFDYVWHKDGNRVKCEKRLYTRGEDGTVSHEVLRLVFRDYLKLGE